METDHFKSFNVWFVTAWFGAVFTCLIFSVLFTFYLSRPQTVKPINQNFKLYAALPQEATQISDTIEHTDARPKIIENFLSERNSPLAPFSKVFVDVSDKYQLDFRLLPSIAMQESNGGKKIISNSFNPFGFGIYEGSAIKFSSWEEAITKVGKTLRSDYLNRGLITPQQIMTKYTPPSVEKGGTWAKGVSSFMAELQ